MRKFRTAFSKLRMSSHKLKSKQADGRAQMQFYSLKDYTKSVINLRTNTIFLLEYPIYLDLRKFYFSRINWLNCLIQQQTRNSYETCRCISISNIPNVKFLLTIDSERYTSLFDIGRKLGQCCIQNHRIAGKHELHLFRQISKHRRN